MLFRRQRLYYRHRGSADTFAALTNEGDIAKMERLAAGHHPYICIWVIERTKKIILFRK